MFGVLVDHTAQPAALTQLSRYVLMYATLAFVFHGRPREIEPAMPGIEAPVVDGVTMHWSKTMPPIEVLDARLSAVMEIPGVFGEMVEDKK